MLKIGLLAGAAALLWTGGALAQEQRPMTPPPEHDVKRLGNTPEAPEPPSLPPDEIIRKFVAKEDEFASVRPTFVAKKTIRIDEYDRTGNIVGQFLQVSEATRMPDGRVVNKVLEHPQSTLHVFALQPEDVKELERIPQFPLNSSQLAKYDLKYIGQEKVDEIDTYIFKVTPKIVDRAHAYLDGIVWVDTQYLEVVKTYGKWVNELGDVKFAQMPFTTFETYRENVDGKYWFPSYERADETLHLKDGDYPVRLVIKWTDFKPLAASVSDTTPAAPGSASPKGSSPAGSSTTQPPSQSPPQPAPPQRR
ncbi:MAG TPA: hypothetical protein VMP12_08245 [Candidatus Sulfotelmatobacter sp.]|nr:hypothetical protein [Candidatus Sulfotelmatobacter sp.]